MDVTVQGGEDRLRLRIEDDGVGMAAGRKTGMGLMGIQERARELGGRLEIVSRPGAGTSLRIEMPVQEMPAGEERAYSFGG